MPDRLFYSSSKVDAALPLPWKEQVLDFPDGDDLFSKNGTINLSSLSVGGAMFYGVDKGGSIVRRPADSNSSGAKWKQPGDIPDDSKCIAIDADDSDVSGAFAAAISAAGVCSVSPHNPAKAMHWKELDPVVTTNPPTDVGKLQQCAVADGYVYVVNVKGDMFRHLVDARGVWAKVTGSQGALSVSGCNKVMWTITKDGIWSAGHVPATKETEPSVMQQPASIDFKRVNWQVGEESKLVQLAAARSHVYGVSSIGDVWRLPSPPPADSGAAWQQLALGGATRVGAFELAPAEGGAEAPASVDLWATSCSSTKKTPTSGDGESGAVDNPVAAGAEGAESAAPSEPPVFDEWPGGGAPKKSCCVVLCFAYSQNEMKFRS